MCKSEQIGALVLRFKARLESFERSRITPAVVWMTRMRGIAGRRPVKCLLHIFPIDFWSFFGAHKTPHEAAEAKQHKTLKLHWKNVESEQIGALVLRFKARFEGFERSRITPAVVWMTRMRGTAGRRPVKCVLHIFPMDF